MDKISIHAPHEGERHYRGGLDRPLIVFQSTLPTRGSDANPSLGVSIKIEFQSTLPTRGSDGYDMQGNIGQLDFNPRSPRGGATRGKSPRGSKKNISIHAPHEGERPAAAPPPWAGLWDFNPRSPRGGATLLIISACGCVDGISIHAPHEGERPNLYDADLRGANFNPRSPRGGATLLSPTLLSPTKDFNPRSPRGGATFVRALDSQRDADFNPRSPRGGATVYTDVSHFALGISIHAPHEGERHLVARAISDYKAFQSTLPTRGSDSRARRDAGREKIFQSTLPTRGSDKTPVQNFYST